MSNAQVEELIRECNRQFEACLYTSTGLYIWQKHARFWRGAFLVIPIVLGGFATSKLFIDFWGNPGTIIAVFCGLVASFFPAIYVSLGLDMKVMEIARAAAEFTNIRDRFRQAAQIHSKDTPEEFKAQFEALMDRLDAARAASPPQPEWCYQRAKRKIEQGDYEFKADEPVVSKRKRK